MRTSTSEKQCKKCGTNTTHASYLYKTGYANNVCLECARRNRAKRRMDPDKLRHDTEYTTAYTRTIISPKQKAERISTKTKTTEIIIRALYKIPDIFAIKQAFRLKQTDLIKAAAYIIKQGTKPTFHNILARIAYYTRRKTLNSNLGAYNYLRKKEPTKHMEMAQAATDRAMTTMVIKLHRLITVK